MDGKDMIYFGERNRQFKIYETHVPKDYVFHSFSKYFTDIKDLEVRAHKHGDTLIINLSVKINEIHFIRHLNIPRDENIDYSDIRKIMVYSDIYVNVYFSMNKMQRYYFADYIIGFHFREEQILDLRTHSNRNVDRHHTTHRSRSRDRNHSTHRSRSRDRHHTAHRSSSRDRHHTAHRSRSRDRQQDVKKEDESMIGKLMKQIEELQQIVQQQQQRLSVTIPQTTYYPPPPMTQSPTHHIVSPTHFMVPSNGFNEYQYPMMCYPQQQPLPPPPSPQMVQQPQQQMVQPPMMQMVQQPQQKMVRKAVDPRLAKLSMMRK